MEKSTKLDDQESREDGNAFAAALTRAFSRKILTKLIRRPPKIFRGRFIRSLSKKRFHLATETGVHAVHHHQVSKLIKSGLLGFAAFETYEQILHWKQKQSKREDQPIHIQILAGMMAGLVHSAVACTWELGHVYFSHRKLSLNHSLVRRRSVHHMIGFGTLFGIHDLLEKVIRAGMGPSEHKTKDFAVTFVAGGFAGQAHYLVSHYSRNCRKWRPINLASLTGAFVPAALGFVALAMDQHGG